MREFSAVAPSGVVIGVIGGRTSGARDLMRLAGGDARPEGGEVTPAEGRRYIGPDQAVSMAPAAVLAVEHALALLDPAARIRTLTGIDRLRQSGSTVLLASHDDALLRQIADEVWWIEGGRLLAQGDPAEVLPRYRDHIAGEVRSWGETIPARLAPSRRRGDGRAEILSLDIRGASGQPTVIVRGGEAASIHVQVRFHQPCEDPVIGILIRTRIGMEVYGTNTQLQKVPFGPVAANEDFEICFAFACELCPNQYTITAASHEPDGTAYDWMDDAIAFTVIDEPPAAGVANLRAKAEVRRAANAWPPA
ncbi:MAG: Wzt carbohydrate-binding domain-containing protein [Bryobacteraceae bacterium]|nr:Wzt carbohydrate-binding domain-containing protein [Bryobacteraceae bacterium]